MPLRLSLPSESTSFEDPRWRSFAINLLRVFVGTLAFLFAILLIVDPFDSGRSPVAIAEGVIDNAPRFSKASNGRDPQFDSAVFGNSHGQILHPRRLSELTGLKFVQMTVPGTAAAEQLVLLRWFMRHHPRIGAIVIAADEAWCTQEPSLPTTNPFPYWLYKGDWEYLSHLLSRPALTRVPRRLALAFGLMERSDPAGFIDYELPGGRTFVPPPLTAGSPVVPPVAFPKLEFPAVDRLAEAIADLPQDAALIVVRPPVFFTSVPAQGSSEAARLDQCQAAFERLLQSRARGGFLNFRVDSEMTRDPRNFLDASHYLSPLAKHVEAGIAAATDELRAKPR